LLLRPEKEKQTLVSVPDVSYYIILASSARNTVVSYRAPIIIHDHTGLSVLIRHDHPEL
jgi:hypothetical protein